MRFEPIAQIAGAFRVWREPFTDARGSFDTSFAVEEFAAAGIDFAVAQAATSTNPRTGTLRGLHYQVAPHEEDKLVRCEHGAIWDAIVDLRTDSPTYGQWLGVELSEDNGRMLLVPRGFAHGFVTLTNDVAVSYQVSNFYTPQAERGARYDEKAFGIQSPVPIRHLSAKDAAWPAHRLMENA